MEQLDLDEDNNLSKDKLQRKNQVEVQEKSIKSEETLKLTKQLNSDKDKNFSKKEIKKKKQNETKEKSSKSDESDEFEKVIQEFAQSNSVCSFTGCKKSTKLIKLICEFCKKWFCLEHGKILIK